MFGKKKKLEKDMELLRKSYDELGDLGESEDPADSNPDKDGSASDLDKAVTIGDVEALIEKALKGKKVPPKEEPEDEKDTDDDDDLPKDPDDDDDDEGVTKSYEPIGGVEVECPHCHEKCAVDGIDGADIVKAVDDRLSGLFKAIQNVITMNEALVKGMTTVVHQNEALRKALGNGEALATGPLPTDLAKGMLGSFVPPVTVAPKGYDDVTPRSVQICLEKAIAAGEATSRDVSYAACAPDLGILLVNENIRKAIDKYGSAAGGGK